jgi:hypothetical protein
MKERSRVKFNPVTKEIEIEGSEKFVKTYFDKIQKLLAGSQEASKPAEPRKKKARSSKKAPKVARKAMAKKKTKKVSKSNAVLALIQDSPEGITTTELKEKTGLADRQIWAVIANAKKAGKIRQVKRGVYTSA